MQDRFRRFLAWLDSWSLSRRWTRVTRRAASGFLQHEALQYAGSMAYFALLSIFQLLVLGVVIGSLVFGEGAARDLVLDQVEQGTPLERDTVGDVIDSVIGSRGAISVLGLALLVWSALGVFGALSAGVGRAFEAAHPRGFVQDKLLGLLLMSLTGVLTLASFVVGLVTGALERAAQESGRVGGELTVRLIGLAVPLVLIFVVFWIIYRIVPNRRVTWGEVWPGALLATVLWTLLRFGFTWYATRVVDYESAFGPISTAITLLVFLYLASVIVLVGAEVARARVLDDELPGAIAADPRLLPVVLPGDAAPSGATLARRRGPSRWLLVAGAAIAGIVAGRLSKRDDD